MSSPRFHTSAFVQDQFGSPAEMARRVMAYGMTPPTLAQIAKWRQRGQIAGEWLVILLALAELESNEPVSVLTYVTLGGSNERGAA